MNTNPVIGRQSLNINEETLKEAIRFFLQEKIMKVKVVVEDVKVLPGYSLSIDVEFSVKNEGDKNGK